MDLGGRDWLGAAGAELVKPPVLAARYRAPEGAGSRARRIGLGPVARPRAGTPIQSYLCAVFLARMDRLWLRRARRHGLLQLRHHLPRAEARSPISGGSELQRSL